MTQAMQTRGAFRDPKTKADLLDRMMMRDFTGDIMDLAEGRNLRLVRVKPHVLRLIFLTSGEQFDLTVHKPRQGEAVAFRKARTTRQGQEPEAPAPTAEEGQEVTAPRRRQRAGPRQQPKAA